MNTLYLSKWEVEHMVMCGKYNKNERIKDMH